MEKNRTVFTNLMQRQNRQKSVMRKAPRCCHCRKYLAEDPNKIGEDEVANLRKCCRCMIATYCSDDCEMKNWTESHKFHCDTLMKDPRPSVVNGILKSDSFSEKDAMPFYLTFLEYASSAQDFNDLREIANFHTMDFMNNQSESGTELNEVHLLSMVSQILLGEDEKAYNFVKQLAYCEARDCKNREKDILRENFLIMEDKKFVMNGNPKFCPTLSKIANQLFWCVLIAIKMNVIEDMKFLLTQYEAYHRRMKKKFWPHPRIINLYTLYILGTDKESFLQDLEYQEYDARLMLNMCQAMMLGLVLDYGHESEEKYRRKSYVELAFRGLKDYFENHSYARNYILNYFKTFPKSFMKKFENQDAEWWFNIFKSFEDPHWKIEMKN